MTDTTKGKPSDATIIAIVDVIEKDGVLTYEKATGDGAVVAIVDTIDQRGEVTWHQE
jgi:microcompartment protein CcmK/EutM